jgi:hypothetical protein
MTKIDNQSKHDEEQNSIHDCVHQAIIELDVGACEADEKHDASAYKDRSEPSVHPFISPLRWPELCLRSEKLNALKCDSGGHNEPRHYGKPERIIRQGLKATSPE